MGATDDAPTVGPPAALSGYTGYLLRRAFVRARASGVRVMPPGRDAKELGVLVMVEEAGPLSQRQLGDILHVNRSAIVKLVDRLEADGLLQRQRDAVDRRNYALQTTPLGREAITEMTGLAAVGDADFTAALTTVERARLVELLGRIVPDIVRQAPAQLSGLSGFLIPRAHLRVRAMAAGPLADLGITPQHFGMLSTLATLEPCSQQSLAAALGVSGAAVIASLDDLESRGLLSRQRNPGDRREQLLRLTSAGREITAVAHAALDRVHEGLAAELGVEELKELNSLLIKVTS